ncbi:MAG: M1 family metallopeptidase [Gemmatirosa sp.]
MLAVLPLLLALQQPAATPDLSQTFAGAPRAPSRTSPANGDTVGYWQQRADYRIVARLDESRGVLLSTARLTYVNASPDTLRELYVHQHLNAFRPGSKWSATDEKEGRVRYQRLPDPHYAYERFTAAPTIDGAAVRAEYPGAPDSTVVRLALPRPLAPRDSVVATFAWEARLSTVPRRQGRRGRHHDFAQWYPRVAVYDRGGWQPHALVPAGEFYGEYGTFDVTLVLRDDQVVGATGVPVAGDPGWARASRGGARPVLGRTAYDTRPASLPDTLPEGHRAVRFVARDVHHFAWSTSPEYRYEGGAYVRPTPAGRPRGWDTVAVHALFQPADDTTWGGGRVVQRTVAALGWLERAFGTYAYPQMTVLHRLDGGGTEFPMMQMNGSPGQSLILHEGGHNFVHGILGNNEWQSGWLDEGLTSYQTSWALGTTAQSISAREAPAVGAAPSEAQRAAVRRQLDSTVVRQARLVTRGMAQPIGLRGDVFVDFGTYNNAVYTRAELMYATLRDAIGDDAFARFLRDYYARWANRHVDEAAMRASAERASGRDLGWFFEQWVHRVGVVDYALRDVSVTPAGDGWQVAGALSRVGAYRHPMAVGVRTASGWTLVRGDAAREAQRVTVRVRERPLEVRLDPHGAAGAPASRFYRFIVAPEGRAPHVERAPAPTLAAP